MPKAITAVTKAIGEVSKYPRLLLHLVFSGATAPHTETGESGGFDNITNLNLFHKLCKLATHGPTLSQSNWRMV